MNTEATTLGIDLGTSEVKLLLLDEQGAIAATAGAPLSVQRPHPHWSEQSPASWWEATQQAARELRERAPLAWQRVQAIGLSGQMHGATLLGANDEVLRPAILWNDTRSADECERLTQAVPRLHGITGNLAMPGFTAPKLLWVRRHEPELFSRVHSVLLPKDYLRWCLTGEKWTDPSDAAGTLWLDVARRDWSDEVLAATGLGRAHMPRLAEGSQVAGRLHAAAAHALALPAGIAVAAGGGDNAASAVGMGCVRPGDGFVSLGTSGVLFVVTSGYRANPEAAVHSFCHALPGRWHQMSVMLSAASCLRWVTRLVGETDEAALMARVQSLAAAEHAQAPIFLPYLGGERTPHNDAHARGVFFDLDHDTDAARLGYSVIEGVCFGLCDGLLALQAAGTTVERLALVGGGARSELWAQLLADTLNLQVARLEGAETGGALGAARLAWLALGADEDRVCQPTPVREVFHPRPASRALLVQRHQRFQALYQHLKPLFRARPA